MSGYQLPPEAGYLGIDLSKYRAGDAKSFRGPCPHCGGSNRFLVFFDNAFPHWWASCDMCGLEGFVDSIFNLDLDNLPSLSFSTSPSHIEIDVEKKLKEYQASRLWEELHAGLSPDNRAWWRDAGIPDSWQDFWQLGYTSRHPFYYKEAFYEREAYSIPKFSPGWVPVNMDFRLIDPPLGAGKYRPVKNLPAVSFYTRPDLTVEGRVIICEGSKKAAVACTRLGAMQIIGVPAAKSWAMVDKVVADCEQVIVVLDPDAEKAAMKLAKIIGKKAIQLTLPTKLDDAFLYGGLTESMFWKLVAMSGRRQ